MTALANGSIQLMMLQEDNDTDCEILIPFLFRWNNKLDNSARFRINLERIPESDFKELFRFEKTDLYRLAAALGLPEFMRCQNRFKFKGIEGLCILLRRFAYPNRLFDLTNIFGLHKEQLSMIIKEMANYIYANYAQLVESLDQWWLKPRYIQKYCNAVYLKGAPLDNCWGFIDGTLRPSCRPSRNQREVYNGHKRLHGLKFQAVVAANGLIANLFGPVPGRRHDCFMLSVSGLLHRLETNMGTPEGDIYSLYGDPAYPTRSHLLGPYRAGKLSTTEAAFNTSMSRVRVTVEWEFGKMVSLFAFLDFKKNLKLHLQPIGKYYIVGAILKNCHACIYGSETSLFFNVKTPTLENYLNGVTDIDYLN